MGAVSPNYFGVNILIGLIIKLSREKSCQEKDNKADYENLL
jgi:hypothetical protein